MDAGIKHLSVHIYLVTSVIKYYNAVTMQFSTALSIIAANQ